MTETLLNNEGHKRLHSNRVTGGFPPGFIAMFGGTTAPEGWLLCDGTSYSAQEYSALYAVIGTTYGTGAKTFTVPDLRSRVPIGAGTFAALGSNEGNTEANRTTLHDHAAGTLDVTTDHNIATNTTTGGGANRATDGGHDISGNTQTALGAATTDAFPHVGVNFIIKY